MPVNDVATGPLGKELFEKEQDDLLSDLKDIPKAACDRRVSYLLNQILYFYQKGSFQLKLGYLGCVWLFFQFPKTIL